MTNKSAKFEIHSDDLQPALTLVEPFIQARQSTFNIETLDTVLLETFSQNNTITFTASDLESTCRVTISVKNIKDHLAIAIPGKNLAKLMKHFDGVVKFKYTELSTGPKLEARFGKSKTTFKTLNAEAFPKSSDLVPAEPAMTFQRDELEQVLKEVLPTAVMADDIRPFLQNVFFDVMINKDRVNIFSADGYQLSLNSFQPTSLTKSAESAASMDFALHHKSIRKLISALHRIQSKIIELYFIEDKILFHAPHEAKMYFLPDVDAIRKMPDYESVSTKEHVTRFDLPLEQVCTFLKRAKILEAGIITIEHKTDNSFIRFAVEGTNLGKTEDFYYAVIVGEREFSIAVSSDRLAGLLKEFERSNTLTMDLKETPFLPINIKLSDSATEMVLMPMSYK